MGTTRRSVVLLVAVVALPACGGAATRDAAPLDAAAPAATVSQEAEGVGASAAAAEGAVELVISDVRSRMSPSRAGVAAVYLDLENPTEHDDALVAASVPPEVAATAEVHETYVMDEGGDAAMDDGHGGGGMDASSGHAASGAEDAHDGMGMMGMREVARVPIPAGGTIALEPGGYHLMLLDLATDLAPGDTFEVTLEFERAGQRTVTAEVRERA